MASEPLPTPHLRSVQKEIPMGNKVQATTSFVKAVGGREELVHAGDIFDDSHEIVRNTPADWWKPLHVRFEVESATSAPGEKRAAHVKKETAK